MSEWETLTLGEVADRVAIKNVDEAVGRVMTVSAAHGLIDQEKFFTKSVASSNLSTYYVLQPGDFVYNKSTSKDAEFGVVARLEGGAPAVVTSLYIPFRAKPEIIDPDYLLMAANGSVFFGSLAGTLREGARSHGLLNVRLNEFFAAKVVLPPVSEQRRIVAVVSAVDAHVRALAAECRATRVLLRAARAERVNDLKIIPTVGKDAFSIVMGPQRSPARAVGPNMTRYLRSFNVGDGNLTLTDVKEMNFSPAEQKKFALMPGDVLVSEGSASESAVGMAAVWHGELPGIVCFQKTLIRYRAIDGVSTPRFVNHWCKWAYESGTFVERASGTNIKHITAIGAVNMPVALPSLVRQDEVSAELDVVETTWRSLDAELAALRVVRADLLSALLSQEITVDAAVDKFVKAA